MIAGADGVNFWKQVKGAAAASIQTHGGDMWLGDAAFVHTTGGNVDTLTTVKQGTLTDGGTSGRRPSYAEPNLTFNGTANWLSGDANVASAAGAFTQVLLFSTTDTVTPHFYQDYGPSAARGGILLDANNKINSYVAGGGNVNEFASAVLNAAQGVFLAPIDNSLGTVATIQPRFNAASANGSRAVAQDMTGQTLGAGNWALGARAFDGAAPGQMVASVGLIALAALSTQEMDAVANNLRILRNV